MGTISLPKLISEGMVLQRDAKVEIWDWASPGEEITGTFLNSMHTAVTDESGEWQVELSNLKTGGPYTMELEGSNLITIQNILVGDVWICSGESNTERADEYSELFATLIRNWRNDWHQGDFPFLFVQLANFMESKKEPSESNWALLREAQLKTLSLPNVIFACNKPSQPNAPTNLTCEYLVNPIGIDAQLPRLRWQMQEQRKGSRQNAYRLIVGTDSTAVAGGVGNVWDTQQLEGDEMLVHFRGKPLEPFTRFYWTVQLWDENNKKSPLAPVAYFETGMMETKNWLGAFILDTEDIDIKAAPYFRKVFTPSGKIIKARIYITAAGLFELSINGRKVGDHLLDPMYTRFDKRNLYLTYDVTNHLQTDTVTLGVLLGNGWYNHQSTAVWDFHKAHWRARPRFCLNLHLTYADGTKAVITTGKDWKTALSPVVFNSIYTAEHYDAQLEQPGWDTPGFDDSQWQAAMEVEAPSQQIVAQVLHPIRITEKIPVVNFTKINDQKYLFDLGTNIAGISQLKVQGEAGTSIRLKHAEMLDENGVIDQSNIDVHYRPTDDSDPFQTDIFILKGEGMETFMPRFNYKGFQYVEVSSDRPIQLGKESLIGMRMHSDVPIAGRIHSSDTLINKIWQATNNSYLSNLFGYPTDCPQREKNGWTGDAHIASETGLYNFDGITIYEKWLADHRDEQQANGVLPSIIPTHGWGYDWGNGPDWTSTIAIIPWNIYLFYGDTTLLAACYENIKRYVDHIADISPSHLTDWGLGDWIPVKDVSDKELTSSIYYYVDASILAKAANLLNKPTDHRTYRELAENIKAAINDKFLNVETGSYASGFQTELSAPLYWGIVPDTLRKKVAEQLKNKVLSDNKRLNVGLLGTKTLLNALSENGYADLAYELAAQDTFPSWGWWIKNGAETLFENWPIDAKSDISRNHIMFGEIGAWFYKALGGIKPDIAQPGFKNVLLSPHFVAGLDRFSASHQSPYGEISSSWKKIDGGKVIYKLSIPSNSTARLTIQGKRLFVHGKALVSKVNQKALVLELVSGTYEFVVEL
ncbi:MAG: alpha-rhamnosidase [Saprospiraceae bacterium]|nr:MAG: alpha-rhamnosidase [Saprospiraceae bacterium]